MYVIVGLGNPGPEYQNTPHNAGFLALDNFATRYELEWRPKYSSYLTDFQRHYASGDLSRALLVKPQLFMNRSGKAVKEIMRFYKITPQQLWVVHDELDLPLGVVRIAFDKSAAGHNGVSSIIDELGTKTFHRIRIGVMPDNKPLVMDEFLTQKTVGPAERPAFKKGIEAAVEALSAALEQGIVKATTTVNQKSSA